MRGDRRALRQVMLNLVSNALKFTPGGGRVTVALDLPEDGTIVLSVADTGIGIAPEAIERIFQPFHQADATITRRYGGTGLGLAISRALVEAHGGKLSLESVQDRGTTVSVRLPRERRLSLAQIAAAPQPISAVAD
jgi:signal transduction histidine kinase